jgi:two-component system, cell cycle sensor histidine kinase and response regulator CckA
MKTDENHDTGSPEAGAIRAEDLDAATTGRDGGDSAARTAEEQTSESRRHDQMMEAVGELAANVAHDFNNILTVIHGHASMLLLKLGPEGVHTKSVNEIRHSAERAANLVRQLLMFGRKQIVQFRDVDLDEVIRSVSGLVRQLAGDHIAVEIHCASGAPPILADRGMVEQVIVNLTHHSRDAMPRGGRLVIKSSVVSRRERGVGDPQSVQLGHFVRLTVSATGSGTDAITPMRQFEPSFTNNEAGKRTALELATVYGIVKQHHGWIEIQGPTLQGTTFQIYFPVSDPASPGSAESDARASNHSGAAPALASPA